MSSTKDTILLADADTAGLEMGSNLLGEYYNCLTAASSARLFSILSGSHIDLILISGDLSDAAARDIEDRIKSDALFESIPVINLAAEAGAAGARGEPEPGMEPGTGPGLADHTANKAASAMLIRYIKAELSGAKKENELIETKKQLSELVSCLNDKVNEKMKEVRDLQSVILTTIADLIEFRDRLTGGHVMRTRNYLECLVNRMIADGVYADELSGWDMRLFLDSAQLHDVGKIAVADSILNKRGRLSDKETGIMRDHALVGVKVIKRLMELADKSEFLAHALNATGFHHEKWDGTGYPMGLKGEKIPLEGRLMAIADVYDALISVRPYKDALTHEEACEIIENGAGTHFDPALVNVFRSVKNELADSVGI